MIAIRFMERTLSDMNKVFLTDLYPELPTPLPCPFCGKDPVIQHDRRYPDVAGSDGCSAFEVICNTWGCPIYCADNSYYRTPEEAIHAWNRRNRKATGTGHWIFGTAIGHAWMKCSNCCVSQSGQTGCWSYCPNCGASMDDFVEHEE